MNDHMFDTTPHHRPHEASQINMQAHESEKYTSLMLQTLGEPRKNGRGTNGLLRAALALILPH
jgi:hypothetical protein